MIHNYEKKKHENRTKKSFLLYRLHKYVTDLLLLYLHISEVGQQLISIGLHNKCYNIKNKTIVTVLTIRWK